MVKENEELLHVCTSYFSTCRSTCETIIVTTFEIAKCWDSFYDCLEEKLDSSLLFVVV